MSDQQSFIGLVQGFGPVAADTADLATQIRVWANGSATGGPSGDGRFPLAGASALSPAAMETRLPTGQPADFILPVFADSAVVRPGVRLAWLRVTRPIRIAALRASLYLPDLSPAATAGVQIDVLAGGASILSQPLRVKPGQTTSMAAGTAQPVLSTIDIADDQELSIDVQLAGVGTRGLRVAVIGSYR